jgi:hypothetical protein
MHPLVWLVANTDLLGKAGTLGFRASDAAATVPAGGRA